MVKDFSKIPIETKPRDLKLEEEILSLQITLTSEFRKNIESEKHIISSKSLTVSKKEKKQKSGIRFLT